MLLSETVKTVMTYQYQQHDLGVEKKQWQHKKFLNDF